VRVPRTSRILHRCGQTGSPCSPWLTILTNLFGRSHGVLRPSQQRGTSELIHDSTDHERDQSMFSRRLTRSVAIGATAIAIGGGAYGIVSATASNGSGTATAATSPSATSGQPVSGGRGSNARSGPAAGGSSGTVDSVSTSSFTISTSAGQQATIDEASSTTYRKGTNASSASAITKGESVLVLGTTNGTTITASQVIVQRNIPRYSPTSQSARSPTTSTR
jgi:hypothetical protein